MCEEIILKKDEKNDIMEAVRIIKSFHPDEVFKIGENSRNLTAEIKERKEEDQELKKNYIERFGDIKQDIKDLRNDVWKSFFGISGFILTCVIGIIIAKFLNLL